MAYIFSRRMSGGDYTQFEIDNRVIGPDPIWSAFLRGTGLPYPVETVVSATQKKQTASRIPDILTLTTSHTCSQRFKDFLEEWEPGVHLFRPVVLKRKNGEPIGDYYLWTVGQDIDCILADELSRFWRPQREGLPDFSLSDAVTKADYQNKYPDRGDGTVIKISKPAVAGRHLWLGGYLGRDSRGSVDMFMSDEMHAAFRKEKFGVVDWRCPVEEIDRPWIAEEQMGPRLDDWREREANIAAHWPKDPPRHGNAR